MEQEEVKKLIEKQLNTSIVEFEIQNVEGVDIAYFHIPLKKRMRLHIPTNYDIVFVDTIYNEVEALVKVSDVLANEKE